MKLTALLVAIFAAHVGAEDVLPIRGHVIFPATGVYTDIPTGSCLHVAVKSSGCMDDCPVNTVAEKYLTDFAVTDNKVEFKFLVEKKNIPVGEYAISATLNVGWCSNASKDEWIRKGDYLSDTVHELRIHDEKNTNIIANVEVVPYGPVLCGAIHCKGKEICNPTNVTCEPKKTGEGMDLHRAFHKPDGHQPHDPDHHRHGDRFHHRDHHHGGHQEHRPHHHNHPPYIHKDHDYPHHLHKKFHNFHGHEHHPGYHYHASFDEMMKHRREHHPDGKHHPHHSDNDGGKHPHVYKKMTWFKLNEANISVLAAGAVLFIILCVIVAVKKCGQKKEKAGDKQAVLGKSFEFEKTMPPITNA